jgi:hypothetical protein
MTDDRQSNHERATMTTNTNFIPGGESTGELRADELNSVTGGFSFSVGFVDINLYGKDAEGGYGLGPFGDGIGLPMVWEANSATIRHQAF